MKTTSSSDKYGNKTRILQTVDIRQCVIPARRKTDEAGAVTVQLTAWREFSGPGTEGTRQDPANALVEETEPRVWGGQGHQNPEDRAVEMSELPGETAAGRPLSVQLGTGPTA